MKTSFALGPMLVASAMGCAAQRGKSHAQNRTEPPTAYVDAGSVPMRTTGHTDAGMAARTVQRHPAYLKNAGKDVWKIQAGATWPKGCLLENISAHPFLPLLASTCTVSKRNAKHSSEEAGAVLVFDQAAGSIRSVDRYQGLTGWYGEHLIGIQKGHRSRPTFGPMALRW